jgi:hypothetical protein
MWLPWVDLCADLLGRCWLSWVCWALREQSSAVQRADARWCALMLSQQVVA